MKVSQLIERVEKHTLNEENNDIKIRNTFLNAGVKNEDLALNFEMGGKVTYLFDVIIKNLKSYPSNFDRVIYNALKKSFRGVTISIEDDSSRLELRVIVVVGSGIEID